MLMTGKQATKMQCCGPMPCGKMNPKDPPHRMCVGDKCMGWRSTGEMVRNKSGDGTFSSLGFCGLAGEPQ